MLGKIKMSISKFTAVTKFRMQRGYAAFVLVGMPLLVADKVQTILKSTFGFSPNIAWLIVIALTAIYIWGLIDNKYLLGHEQGYVFSRNTEWKKFREEGKDGNIKNSEKPDVRTIDEYEFNSEQKVRIGENDKRE